LRRTRKNLNNKADNDFMADFNRRILISTPFTSDTLFITVTDSNGTIVKNITTWDDQYHLNLLKLPAGTYVITVQKGEIIKTKKVILK
jgi:hypothetical protein